MDVPAAEAPVIRYLADVVPSGSFMLVDVGCSGGIHPVWRQFGPRLKALALDPNIAEVDRLRKAETHPGIGYLAGFAGLPKDHPFLARKAGRGDHGRNPWARLSVAQSQAILQKKALSAEQQTAANLWQDVELADPVETVVLPDYLRAQGVTSVDFLKIDIDGKDLDVLTSFDAALDALGVLGLAVEVNFFGSSAETDHTFHNTDRFLKERGFELFNLSVRRYSVSALPSKYVYHLPAATESGRILQGDAFYARDLASPEHAERARSMGPQKLVNLICLYAAFGLPDCASEIAVDFRDMLSPLFDVDRVLDLLAAQSQEGHAPTLSHREWLERFQAQDPMFFRPVPSALAPVPARARRTVRSLVQRLLSVVRAGDRSA